MKNLFGKVLVGAAAFAMAIGVSAFAADPAITDLSVAVKDKTAGTVTVSGTVTGDAASKEATIIVLPESIKTLAEDFSNADIKYIDQETAQTGGAFSFDFTLTPGVKYNVWCGGTEVAATALGSGEIDLTNAASGYKIIGTVMLPAGKLDSVTVKAVSGETEVDGVITAKESETDIVADYEIAVAEGTYTVVVGKPGYLYKKYDVTVAGANASLTAATLIPGQLTGEAEEVDLSDLTLFLSHYNEAEGDENFDAMFDLDDSGEVNLSDLTLLLSGYGQSYPNE